MKIKRNDEKGKEVFQMGHLYLNSKKGVLGVGKESRGAEWEWE